MRCTVKLACGLILMCACADPRSEPPLGPTSSAVVAAATVIASASGSGHAVVSGELRTFSFTAVKRADGTVSGSWQFNNRSLDRFASGDVRCLTVIGNRAWIAGLVRHTNQDIVLDFPYSRFWVVDNGEGTNSPPDQISTVAGSTSQATNDDFCATTPENLALFAVERGGLQVR